MLRLHAYLIISLRFCFSSLWSKGEVLPLTMRTKCSSVDNLYMMLCCVIDFMPLFFMPLISWSRKQKFKIAYWFSTPFYDMCPFITTKQIQMVCTCTPSRLWFLNIIAAFLLPIPIDFRKMTFIFICLTIANLIWYNFDGYFYAQNIILFCSTNLFRGPMQDSGNDNDSRSNKLKTYNCYFRSLAVFF